MIHVTSGINTSGMTTINTSSINHMSSSIMSDDMSEPSSPESHNFDDSDMLTHSITDVVTAQLAAAGPIGVAAAAAIATGKKRKRPHSFETNPSIRKRQQTRLLRKLKNTIEEYTTRVGQQAIVLCCTPGKPAASSMSYKVFGSQPLETVVRQNRSNVMTTLEEILAQQAPPPNQDTAGMHELPPLVIDGIPTPVDKMTQAQLRNFIPEMLKYSTGRSKPGWGKPEFRPVWWPSDLPWANVRSDVRTEEDKKRVSWTHALRTIVKNCYKHHGREDMFPQFAEQPQQPTVHYTTHQTMVQTINNPDGTVSIIQIDAGNVLPGHQVVTLSDGTQATVVHALPPHATTESTQAAQTLAEVATHHHDSHMSQNSVSVEMTNETAAHALATVAEAHLQDGSIILTDAHGLGGGDGNLVIPVSMYQTVVSGGHQLVDGQTVHVAMAPTNTSVPDATHAVEIISMDTDQVN